MSPIITNIIYIIINCFTAFIIHRFMKKAYVKKISYCGIYFLSVDYFNSIFNMGCPLITFLCNILSLSLIATLYQGSVKKKISSVIFIYLFMYVIELIFIAASGIKQIHITDRSEQIQLVWHITMKLVTFIVAILAGGFKNIKEHKYSSNMLFVSGIIIPASSAYLILAIFETIKLILSRNKFVKETSVFLSNSTVFPVFNSQRIFKDKGVVKANFNHPIF